MNLGLLVRNIQAAEGLRLKPYRDTVGKLTIGFGRNLDDVGIREPEAQYMLALDIEAVTAQIDKALPWWRQLNEDREAALAEMAFNLGIAGLLEFKHMLAALEAGDYEAAADHALDSQWAKQVGKRAERIARMLRTGEA